MAALLAGDEHTPSLRGKVDLIYIDPPFDSKADYRTKVNLPGLELEQKPTVIEQFAYSDTWSDGTASYLACLNKAKTSTRQAFKILRNALAHNNIVDLPGHGSQLEKLVLFSKKNWYSSSQRMDGWHVLVTSVDAFRVFLEAWFDLLKDDDSYLGAAKAVANA